MENTMFLIPSKSAIAYTTEQIEKKEVAKRTAASELARITDYHTRAEEDPLLKPLPPLPKNECSPGDKCKRKKIAEFFGLGKLKKKGSDDGDVDYNAVFGNPVSGPRGFSESHSAYGSQEELTALPQMQGSSGSTYTSRGPSTEAGPSTEIGIVGNKKKHKKLLKLKKTQ